MKFSRLFISALAAFTVFTGLQSKANAQTIPLGSASNFAILAGSGITVGGAVLTSPVTGDIGTFPTATITGFGNLVLTGTNHAGDAVTQAAKTALGSAYTTAATGRPVTATVATELGATTKTAGVYDSASGTFGITGILTLDALGDPNAVFIFKTATTLITAPSSQVKLTNGAQAINVFWQVGSSATLGSSSIFKGNILALTAITLGTSSTIEGRMLAQNALVTLDGSNTLALPLAAQTITFAAVADRGMCNGAFTLAPTSDSGLAVTLAITGGGAFATIAGNTVTPIGAGGPVTLTATQAGNGTYAAATPVARTFTVTTCPQTITFAPVADRGLCTGAFTVSPTSDSGLAVALAVTSGPATVSGFTVTPTGTGPITLTATQAGNGTYSAAAVVSQTFTVTTCPQTITFAAVADRSLCDGAFVLAPTASSGLAVTLAVASGPATVLGNTVTPTGVGTITLVTTQTGNGTYAAAPAVTRTFAVAACAVPPGLTPQTVAFAPVADHVLCDGTFTVVPAASSGLAVTLTVTSGPATVSGYNVTLTGTGNVTLQASQAGNGSYAGATPVTRTFAVTACPLTAQTITFAAISNHIACDAPFTFVVPVASSGLPVTLAVSGPATVSGNTVTLTGAVGTVSVTASQAGNGTFAPASSVTRSFAVAACTPAPTAQTITFAPIPNHTACDAPFTFVAPVASSGLPVTLAVSGPAIVSGNTITLIGTVGTVVVTASQAGNGTFAAASNVAQSFVVAACTPATTAQTITFAPIPNHTACDAPFSFVIPVASSGLPVTLAVSGPAIVTGNTITLIGTVGTVVVTASQAGNTTFGPASSVTQSFAVAACCVPPVISSPLTAAAILGTPFGYAITASGSPTSYTAFNLPPGLVLNAQTGVISGTPTRATTTFVTLTATNGACTGTATLMIVTAPVPIDCVPPIITNNPLTAAGALGTPFRFAVTASGSPTSYTAFNLPPGLVINETTGVISGTPTRAATTFVTLTATSGACSGTAVLMIVTPATAVDCVPPVINNSSLTTSGVVGTPFRFAITASGSPTSYTAFNLPPGLVLDSRTGVISGTPTHNDDSSVIIVVGTSSADNSPRRERTIGPTFVTITASNGTCTSIPVYLLISISPAPVAPIITSPTTTCPATVGTPFAFAVTATGTPTTYAATGLPAGLTINPATGAISGTPTKAGISNVTISATNSGGTGNGNLTLVVAPVSCIINVSARMNVTPGEGTLVVGLVIKGSGPKTVLVRGVGPTLSVFGVTGVLADPAIAVFAGTTQIAVNDNWETGTSTAAQITAASAQVGAFALTAGSKDAALLVTLEPGAYSVRLTGVGNTTGAGLVEVYDTQ